MSSDIGIGGVLRDRREELGRSLQEAADSTRVRAEYLNALEEEQFGSFGGDVYAKGFLSTYARYLDLDPQPLLERYRRYVQHDSYDPSALASGPVAKAPSGPPPVWIAWVIVAVLVFAGAVAMINVFGGNVPEPAPTQGAPPQPADTPTGPAPSDTPRQTASPTPSPTPTYEGVNLLLAFEEDCWVRVTVDGQVIQEGLVQSGQALTYEGDEQIVVRFGNAGGVRAELNGENLGTQGGRGEVVTVTFTEDGASTA